MTKTIIRLLVAASLMATMIIISGCSGKSGGVFNECVDMDAGADSLKTSSYVIIKSAGDDVRYDDTCITDHTLAEYECQDGKVVKMQYNCFEKFQTRCFTGECG